MFANCLTCIADDSGSFYEEGRDKNYSLLSVRYVTLLRHIINHEDGYCYSVARVAYLYVRLWYVLLFNRFINLCNPVYAATRKYYILSVLTVKLPLLLCFMIIL